MSGDRFDTVTVLRQRHVLRCAGLLVLACLALTGCNRASVLQGRIHGVTDLIAQAERNGAYRCAPRELAIARANLEFATVEIAQGNLDRADTHFNLAEPNGRAAFRMSPPERCNPREIRVTTPEAPPEPEDQDGDGILDPDDQCPTEPEDFDGYEDDEGCPEDQDQDGDGIADHLDSCPIQAEDFDEYHDADGCPEPDNDLDGNADVSDRCVGEPEDMDGYQDSDGCPDLDNDGDRIPDATDQCPNEPGPAEEQGCPRVYQDVEVTSTSIVIRQRIYFEYNRDVIRPRSFPILNTVAQVLADFPDIQVEIQGHTDSRGRDEYNMNLSQRRSDAVRQYLLQQGVDASRMVARGYGETRPIDTNRTAEGREANRRVEFVRTDAAARESAAQEAVP